MIPISQDIFLPRIVTVAKSVHPAFAAGGQNNTYFNALNPLIGRRPVTAEAKLTWASEFPSSCYG